MIKCWHYRRIISRSLDENTPLPPAAQAHIANCQDCRRLCEVEHEIVRRLSASAAAQKRSQPPPFLQARIMAQIASSPPAATRASKPFSRYWPAALAIACLVLTIILFRPGRHVSQPSPGQIARVQSPKPVENNSARNWSDPALLTGLATNLDQPLETEMHAVLQDARGAATALADNFFPDKLRQTLFAETSAQH
jgi:hypothetical protein